MSQAKDTARRENRFHLALSDGELKAIDDYRFRLRIATRAEAARRLINNHQALVDAMPDLSHVISWLENGCDPKMGAKELRIYQNRIDAALLLGRGESQ